MKPLSEKELREKILKICHKYEDNEFMAAHGKCDMDLAAPRCAKRVKEIEKLILQDRKAWGEQVQKNMADNLINQERTLYKIFDDDISICVGIKKMADEVREYYDGGIYQKG